jgi:hypothetical protein
LAFHDHLARAADDAIFVAGEPAVGAADGYWREVMVLRGRLGARVT